MTVWSPSQNRRQSNGRNKTQEARPVHILAISYRVHVPWRRLTLRLRWLLAGNRLINFHLSQNLVIGADLERMIERIARNKRASASVIWFSIYCYMPDSLLAGAAQQERDTTNNSWKSHLSIGYFQSITNSWFKRFSAKTKSTTDPRIFFTCDFLLAQRGTWDIYFGGLRVSQHRTSIVK